MKTATVRELRNNFPKLSRWLKAGEKVEITVRGVPMATLDPKPQWMKGNSASKDLKAAMRKRFSPERLRRLKELSGGKTLPGNAVLRMREETRW